MTTTIVKVQRPLASNAVNPPWLVYDRNRKHQETIIPALIPSHVIKAMGDNPKGYFMAAWSNGEGWLFGDRAADQEW